MVALAVRRPPQVDEPNEPEWARLVVRAASGEYAAFAALYDLYAQRVYNMILRSVRDPQAAEDLAQEVWMKAHRELRTLREPRCFPAWLYRIAAKKCIDTARRTARRPLAAPLTDDVSAPQACPEDSAVAREDAARIWDALAGLSPKQHMALYLREVELRSYREIAYVLGISETAVGLCIFRARAALMTASGRLQDSPGDACVSMHRLMSLSLDAQATPVQRHALEMHVDRCSGCRTDFTAVQMAGRGYAGLALAPAPFVLNEQVLGAAVAKSATLGLGGKLTAWLAPNLKAAALAGSVAVTAGATTVVAAPQVAHIVRGETAAHTEPSSSATKGDPSAPSADAANSDPMQGSLPRQRDAQTDTAGPPIDLAPIAAATVIALPPEATLPDSPIALPPPDKLIDDTLTTVEGVLDSTLTTVDATVDDVLTTLDETVDETLAGVDETLADVGADVDETLTVIDETLTDVDETLDGVTAPILGPPAPADEPANEPTPLPDDDEPLEPVLDLLPLP